jgi:hypothetical protein
MIDERAKVEKLNSFSAKRPFFVRFGITSGNNVSGVIEFPHEKFVGLKKSVIFAIRFSRQRFFHYNSLKIKEINYEKG